MYNFLDRKEYTLIDPFTISDNGIIFCGYRNKKPRLTYDLTKSRAHKQPNRIYSADGVMITLSSQEVRYFVFDGEKVGRLTARECLRLMGFDDTFKIVVSDSQVYKQAGNSIVVNVLESIFKNINWESV